MTPIAHITIYTSESGHHWAWKYTDHERACRAITRQGNLDDGLTPVEAAIVCTAIRLEHGFPICESGS